MKDLDLVKPWKKHLWRNKFNYLYDDETDYFFMNPESFEQINIKKEIVGDKGKLLTENLEVTINFHDETPLSVNLPNQIKSKIETTDAALKGQTVSSSYKPAILDNGLSIQVPPFIESGDEIIVDSRTIEYVKKSLIDEFNFSNLNIMIKACEKLLKQLQEILVKLKIYKYLKKVQEIL